MAAENANSRNRGRGEKKKEARLARNLMKQKHFDLQRDVNFTYLGMQIFYPLLVNTKSVHPKNNLSGITEHCDVESGETSSQRSFHEILAQRLASVHLETCRTDKSTH